MPYHLATPQLRRCLSNGFSTRKGGIEKNLHVPADCHASPWQYGIPAESSVLSPRHLPRPLAIAALRGVAGTVEGPESGESAMWDVIVLGAGAAGLMAGIVAARRGRRVLVLDHAKAPGEKIRISGGGRCNFTNLQIAPERFLSANPRFALSALRRFTQHDFIARMEPAVPRRVIAIPTVSRRSSRAARPYRPARRDA